LGSFVIFAPPLDFMMLAVRAGHELT